MRSDKAVVFLSGDDWSATLTTSKFHMANQLADDGFKVLYVNSVGLKRQSIGAGSNIGAKIKNRLEMLFRGTEEVRDNVRVVTPFVIPLYENRLVAALNRVIIRFQIRRQLRAWGIRSPELWAFLPTHKDMLGQFDEVFSLYYCVDEFTHFEGVDKAMITRFEEQMIKDTDLLVATAKNLLKTKQLHASETLYLPHGVDTPNFRRAVVETDCLPQEFTGRPTVGFFGLMANWLDLDLIAEAAKKLPQFDFLMIGRIVADIGKYEGIENLRFVGPRPFRELASYCRGFFCGIMPFKIDEMTVNINPIKMREYLVAGLPVVSTAMPEVIGYSDYVTVTRSSDEFVAALEKLSAADVDRTAISDSMKSEDWKGRYEILRSRIDALKTGK